MISVYLRHGKHHRDTFLICSSESHLKKCRNIRVFGHTGRPKFTNSEPYQSFSSMKNKGDSCSPSNGRASSASSAGVVSSIYGATGTCCPSHKDRLRTSQILKYESQNLDFPVEIGSPLTCNEKFVEFSICNALCTLDCFSF